MFDQQARTRFKVLLRVGIPYTIFGVCVVLGGIYLLKNIFADSDYLLAILLLWLAVFWFIYQPLFRKKILEVARQLESKQ